MPIGDLLAQISGDKATDSPAPAVRRSDLVLSKRKADEDLRNSTSKTPRFTPPSKTSQPSTNGNSARPTLISSRPLNNGNRVAKPAAPIRRPPPQSSEPSKPKAPPKKGSFAEILARGQRAQAVMGQVGKIQHKKAEKGAIKKDAPKEELARKPATTVQGKRPMSGYSGTSKSVAGQQRNVTSKGDATSASKANRNSATAPPRPGAGGKKTEAVEAEKKVKKAVLATAGYTGTARPRPGASTKKGNAPRGGALLNAPPHRAGSSKRSRYEDEYDEDMDGFIDYDDEEDDGGQRYDYNSDGSSDMEAGMSDIDDEERRAEKIARLEDMEEERLEKSLKSAKEERKRQAFEALRANRRQKLPH